MEWTFRNPRFAHSVALEQLRKVQNLVLLECRKPFVYRLGSLDETFDDFYAFRSSLGAVHRVLHLDVENLFICKVILVLIIIACANSNGTIVVPVSAIDLVGGNGRYSRDSKLIRKTTTGWQGEITKDVV